MIALLNIGRFAMLVWIVYGLLLIFAPQLLHRAPNQMGGFIQVAVAYAVGYLLDRALARVRRRRTATLGATDSPAGGDTGGI